MSSTPLETSPAGRAWCFVTAHALALIELARDPNATIRTLADRLELTERHTHRIISDLVEAGYVTRTRIGRRNRYEIDPSRELRSPTIAGHEVGDLLHVLAA